MGEGNKGDCMTYRNVLRKLKMPKGTKITDKTSTITGTFVTSILPFMEPSEEEFKEYLKY